MRDITEYVNQTVFKNDVFKYLSTESTQELSVGYKPGIITSWNYGAYGNYSQETMSMMCHEMAHVVDMFERKPHRLLQNDFGYIKNAKADKNAALIECKVTAMQFMVEQTYPDIFYSTPNTLIFNILKNFRDMEMNFDDFNENIEKYMQEYPIERIINVWSDACKFLKDRI